MEEDGNRNPQWVWDESIRPAQVVRPCVSVKRRLYDS